MAPQTLYVIQVTGYRLQVTGYRITCIHASHIQSEDSLWSLLENISMSPDKQWGLIINYVGPGIHTAPRPKP